MPGARNGASVTFMKTPPGVRPLDTTPIASRRCPVPLSCSLSVKVIPNAHRDEIVGWLGGSLKVKVHAPALEGRANEALCAIVARQLGLPKGSVTLVRGARSRTKLLAVSGLADGEMRARVAARA